MHCSYSTWSVSEVIHVINYNVVKRTVMSLITNCDNISERVDLKQNCSDMAEVSIDRSQKKGNSWLFPKTFSQLMWYSCYTTGSCSEIRVRMWCSWWRDALCQMCLHSKWDFSSALINILAYTDERMAVCSCVIHLWAPLYKVYSLSRLLTFAHFFF